MYPPPTAPARPRSDALPIVLIVVVVILVVGAIVGVLVLSSLLSGIFAAPVPHPVALLNSTEDLDGNVTVTVETITQLHGPENFRFQIQRDAAFGPITALPAAGQSTTVQSGSVRLSIRWIDDGDGLVSAGDAFHVRGDGVPLPLSNAFVFYLRWSDGTILGATTWST